MYVSTGLSGLERGMRQEYSTKLGQEARGPVLPRLVHLWKDRLTAAVGQPAFWALGKSGGLTPPCPTQGSLEKGRGLVLGKTKSHGEATVTRVVVAAGRRTPPRLEPLKSRSESPLTQGNRILLAS